MHALNFVVENNFRGGILVAIWVTEPPPTPELVILQKPQNTSVSSSRRHHENQCHLNVDDYSSHGLTFGYSLDSKRNQTFL